MSLDLAIREQLVEALLQCDCMIRPASRANILRDLPDYVQSKVNGEGTAKEVVDEIVRACDQFDDGIDALLARVKFFEGETTAWQRIAEIVQPPSPPKRGPAIEQFGEETARREAEEIKGANKYLLGDQFVGREQELADLSTWLGNDQERMLCICDLGGTGKSALVWHWFNLESTRKQLADRGFKVFWATFYARNFDATKYLQALATELGVPTVIHQDVYGLARSVLERLRKEKWLLVLDGLEREMGAFKSPEHYQIDSEEQDRRNENGEILYEEKYIRSFIFSDFLKDLLQTRSKVLITSRIFPADLMSDDPSIVNYRFEAMSPEDSMKVWALSGRPENSPFLLDFFKSVDYHPQVISAVAAAVKEDGQSFRNWFLSIPEEDRQLRLDRKPTFTDHRHYWLSLATRDLIHGHRNAWLTILYIVRRSEASRIEVLEKELVDESPADQSKPGRFASKDKLIEVLDYLMKRRLVGVDFTQDLVDVHPVIRSQVMRYILKQFDPGGMKDPEAIKHIESGESNNLLLRFVNLPDLDERYQLLSPILGEVGESPGAKNLRLHLLGKLYAPARPSLMPWLESLPATRLRREQAIVLQYTANELMTRGQAEDWDHSEEVFRRAMIAYQLCGDFEQVKDCLHSHDWQSLYGGTLHHTERHKLEELEKAESSREQYLPYWLALMLAIRQSEMARELLEILPAEKSRWTLQTVAEAWFYLENYEKARELAQLALDRREQGGERQSIGQWLWEKVTIGLALVWLDRGEEALEHLNFAQDRGTGVSYNLVPMFAQAGLIELRYREAMKNLNHKLRFDKLGEINLLYKRYCTADPHNRFQIPAAEVHLTMARVHLARDEREDAIRVARLALEIAKGKHTQYGFGYASAVERATQFLVKELGQSAPPVEKKTRDFINHEKRLKSWMQRWRDKKGKSDNEPVDEQ